MAWDTMHRSIGGNGQIRMTPGYMSEEITLGNNADASTSVITMPHDSDMTVLIHFSAELAADTYVQVEHSWDGSTWVKQGNIEEDGSVDHDDISKDISKIAALVVSLLTTRNGVMMLYDIDSHGASRFMRFTIKANGQDESGGTATFYLFPHF